jgi:hypothetical protein
MEADRPRGIRDGVARRHAHDTPRSVGTAVPTLSVPDPEVSMAELTPLDEKLAEVLGLAQAAQGAVATVAKLEDAEDFREDLDRMRDQAGETERRTDALVDGLEGRKTAIREMARETKAEATDMMKTYLEGEEEALDGFEFLSMAEAGELCHWEIVERMSEATGEDQVHDLATWAVGVQRDHVEMVRRASLQLAAQEVGA